MFQSRIWCGEKEFEVFNWVIWRTHGKSPMKICHKILICPYLGREWTRVFYSCWNESGYPKSFIEFVLCNFKSQTRKNRMVTLVICSSKIQMLKDPRLLCTKNSSCIRTAGSNNTTNLTWYCFKIFRGILNHYVMVLLRNSFRIHQRS